MIIIVSPEATGHPKSLPRSMDVPPAAAERSYAGQLATCHHTRHAATRHAQTAAFRILPGRVQRFRAAEERTAAQRGAAVMTALFRISCAALYCICALAFIDSSGKYVFKPVIILSI